MLRTAIVLLLIVSAFAVNKASKPNLRLTQSDLTVLRVSVGLSSKRDVQARFGSATFFKDSKDEEADDVLCYLSANQSLAMVFYFGPLGGWNDVTAIAVSKVKALPWSRSSCLKTTKVPEHLQFFRGVSLEISRDDLAKTLGPASRVTSTAANYNVSHACSSKEKRKGNAADDCIEVSWVDATFDHDALSFIKFGQYVDQ